MLPVAFVILLQIDDWIVKKTVGGPKRFHPKSREELLLEVRLAVAGLFRCSTLTIGS